ncbi:MAG: leucine-rich repeat protein, partial [Lachnospiraceae bacterium]|nr:leucine-rich repeat protein [Lachnospiraceae bacterium]
MSKRGKHTKRVFAMLLAFIMCLSQAVTAAADEVSDNKTVPETVSEESTAAEPEEPAGSGPEEAVSGNTEDAAGDTDYPVSGNYKYVVSGNNNEVILVGHKDGENASGSLDIPASINGLPVTVISNNAFYNCYKLKGNLTIPDSVTTIGDGAFMNCSGLDGSLKLGKNVKTIGDNAFQYCNKLTGDLSLPESLETIGDNAFQECSKLTGDLTIPDKVETIGENAFRYCHGLRSLKLGKNLKTIGSYAFYDGNSLSGSLIIPDGVETIGECAFSNCSGFNSDLIIPASVKIIDTDMSWGSFAGCYSVSTVSNASAVAMPVNWFWKNGETACFVSENGTELRYYESEYRTDYLGTGIYVKKVKPDSFTLSQTSVEGFAGKTVTLSADITPANAYDRISWESSDESVAKVSNGVVTFKGAGKAVITAAIKDDYDTYASDTCAVTVKGIHDKLVYTCTEDGKE